MTFLQQQNYRVRKHQWLPGAGDGKEVDYKNMRRFWENRTDCDILTGVVVTQYICQACGTVH